MRPYGEHFGFWRGVPRTERTPAGVVVIIAKTTRSMLRRQAKKRARREGLVRRGRLEEYAREQE